MRILIILLVCLYSIPTNFIISDFDFTNQNFETEKLLQIVSNYKSKLSDDEIRFILYTSKKYVVSPIIVLTKIDNESSLIRTSDLKYFDRLKMRCLGYGLHIKWTDGEGKKYCPYENFYCQIDKGVYTLRYWFNDFKKNKKINIEFGKNYNKGELLPVNAATYALYKYTPVWAGCWDYDKAQGKVFQGGNLLFLKIYNILIKDYNKIHLKK